MKWIWWYTELALYRKDKLSHSTRTSYKMKSKEDIPELYQNLAAFKALTGFSVTPKLPMG